MSFVTLGDDVVEILPPGADVRRGGKSQEAPPRSARCNDVILGQMACGFAEAQALKNECRQIMERLRLLREHLLQVQGGDAVVLRYANNTQRLENEVTAMCAGIVAF